MNRPSRMGPTPGWVADSVKVVATVVVKVTDDRLSGIIINYVVNCKLMLPLVQPGTNVAAWYVHYLWWKRVERSAESYHCWS